MANKPRLGLDYYVIPVNYLRNSKIRLLKKRFGSEGIHALEFLKGIIFESGSFLKFDDKDEIYNAVEEEVRIDNKKAIEIVNGLIDLNLFSKNAFELGYLTSVEIQEHYYFATKERKVRVQNECWLLSKEKMDDIDSGIKYKNILGGKNSILPRENEIIDTKDRQSKSNSETKRKSKKEEIEYKERMKKIKSMIFPFNANYYFMMLIADDVISGYESFSEKINSRLILLSEEVDADTLFKAVRKTINCIKSNHFKDEEGRDIDFIDDYILSSIENNIHSINAMKEYPRLDDELPF